jgi:uncharacterized protein YndB with AHSA1/START domain
VSETPPGALRLERTFRASAQRVFEAWTSEEVLRLWWHAEHDWETPHAEIDPRVGGVIRATMRNPHDGSEHGGGGVFTVLERPRRLAFTWTWTDVADEQLIEVEFHEHEGETTVILTNRGLRDADLDDHREGWQNSFDNLELALAG